ncbi:lumenal Hsp70 protein [Allomyces javanicus]|nr:lumenal Hsp70 protein [Allomyces javanicus]
MKRPRRSTALAALFLVLFCAAHSALARVLAIDYGTDWFKAAVVAPGTPLDVVLNRESKRKTHALVTLRTDADERLFGSDAAAVAPRFPTATYPHLKALLGKTIDDPAVAAYRAAWQRSNDDLVALDSQRKTVAFRSGDQTWSVEELIAMQLAHAKQQAETWAKRNLTETVLTIPAHFNQFERKAMLDAAELAGLNVKALLHEGTAVAINYAMTRTFPTAQSHIFYDIGAGSTTATLATFSGTGNTNKPTHPVAITVDAVSSDADLGGSLIDSLLITHLATAFETQHGTRPTTPRATVKLAREAARIKQILSVNVQVTASIEALHDERDLRVVVTRAEFESLLAPLRDRVIAPLRTVLAAGKSPSSVVLVGGATRIPLIQAWIDEELASATKGAATIARNVNGDEAVVLGAALYGAAHARGFRVRPITVASSIPYDVTVQNGLVLFPAHKAVLGSTKSVTLKRKETQVGFTLAHGAAGNRAAHLMATVTGQYAGNAAVTEHKGTFRLSEFGAVEVVNVTVQVTTGGGILGLGAATNQTVVLDWTVESAVPDMPAGIKANAVARLAGWNEREAKRHRREAAQHAVEALVYSVRDRADPDSGSPLTKVASTTELESLAARAKEAGEWLDDTDADEDPKYDAHLDAHLADLRAAVEVVESRVRRVYAAVDRIRADARELKDVDASKWADAFLDRATWDQAALDAYAKTVADKAADARRRAQEERDRIAAEIKAKAEELRKAKEAEAAAKKAAAEAAKKANETDHEKVEPHDEVNAGNEPTQTVDPNEVVPEGTKGTAKATPTVAAESAEPDVVEGEVVDAVDELEVPVAEERADDEEVVAPPRKDAERDEL